MYKFLDITGLNYLWGKIKSLVPDLSKKASSIPFGQVDSTSTNTVFTAQVDGIDELRDGVCCYLRNGVVTSTTNWTLNINDLGAKPVYSTLGSTDRVTTSFNLNYTMLFVYNSTRVTGGCWDMYYGNVGSLKTDNTTAQTPSASESFTGDISLHKVAKTGSYNDLNNKPTIPSSGDFVTSLGTSGNNVTWTKNGTTNNLIVPYAASAKRLNVTSTDNAVVRFDGTGGDIQNSGVTINDSNHVTAAKFITSDGTSSQFVRGDGTLGSVTSIGLNNLSYLITHPENNYGVIVPFIYNDLAFLTSRGGSVSIYSTTSSDLTQETLTLKNDWNSLSSKDYMFDSSPTYWQGGNGNSALMNADGLIIDIVLPNNFTYSNKFYIDFGSSSWGYDNIDILVKKSNNETNYVSKVSGGKIIDGSHYFTNISHTSTVPGTDPALSEAGFDRMRIHLSTRHASAPTSNMGIRIAQIGLINYSSQGQRFTSMSRGIDDYVYRNITPNTGGSYNLGSSARYWNNIYANKFIKNGGTSSQFLKADGSVDSSTYATISVNSANALIGSLPQWTADPSDDVYLIRRDTGGSPSFGQVKFSTVWNYIKSKISSVLGIGGSNGVPTAPTATAGTNTTQIATTAFVNTATSGFANDTDVVHKANAETITGEKTFNAGVVVSAESQLKFETAQDEGVYIEANDNSGDKVLTLGNIEDDSPVRLENIATPVLGTDAANKDYANNPVLIEKTFEPYTISAADIANGYLFFLNVVPTSDNFYMPWKVKYKLFITTTESYTQGEYDCEIGSAGTSSNYSFFNRFYSTSYPSYNHVMVWYNSSTKYANKETNPIKIGERIYSARNDTTLARVFKIQVYEAINCEVSFPENIEKYGDVYTDAKYGYCSTFNATNVGLQETGDLCYPNYYNYEYYTSYHIHGTDTPLYRYKLCGFDVQGRLVPITSTNQTSATIVQKIPNTVPMDVSKGIVFYYSSTIISDINTVVGTGLIYRSISTINLPITYNFNTTNIANCNVYLVGDYDKTTGMFTLDNSGTNSYYLYALNTGTESEYFVQFIEGKYYWLLGNITDSYFNFLIDKPLFYFDGTKLIDYNLTINSVISNSEIDTLF